MALPSNCDENAPAVEITIDYLSSEDLKPLSDPDTQIQGLLEGLESKDWIKVCESLNDTRRLAIYHSTLLLPLLEPVVVVLVKAMKNPRSALCKTSIMAAADIFVAYRDKLLEPDFSGGFDNLLLQLLLKASQDKRFVCEEAEKTLKTMVQSITPLPLLHNLQKYARHSNPKVRAKAAVFSFYNCSEKNENYTSFERRDKLGCLSTVPNFAIIGKDPDYFASLFESWCEVINNIRIPSDTVDELSRLRPQLLLGWDKPSCGLCEGNVTRCAFKRDTTSTLETTCIAFDPPIVRELSKNARYAIGFSVGLGVPAVLVIAMMLYKKATRSRRRAADHNNGRTSVDTN